jgi:L-seryl-tRNA(Ser) seleniumtransferase
VSANLLRHLPSVNDLLQHAGELLRVEGHDRTVGALRAALDDARAAIKAGGALPSVDDLLTAARRNLTSALSTQRSALINATGVIIHTNLGRAPLSAAAQQAMLAVAQGYTPLEFDIRTGERGRRAAEAETVICEVTGAEAALVVNNCAAATVLMLAAHAAGRGVVVSRGQLVEIGGGFRVPDIMKQSGARLIEVGTTNRVKPADYARALHENADAAALLRVHASNFKMIGFVEEVDVAGLVAVSAECGLRSAEARATVLDDLGSGALIDTSRFGLSKEPMPQDSLRAGADVVAFSGDKLLGGPQAGVMVGTHAAIEQCRRHPLARAFRADKYTLAALGATLLHYARGEAERAVPVIRMMALTLADIGARAEVLLLALSDWAHSQGVALEVADARSTVGGGSLPGETLPTRVLALTCASPDALLAELRSRGVIARINEGRVLLDPRTVLDDAALVAAVLAR